jgi:membrane associated rhomboid family serine protease
MLITKVFIGISVAVFVYGLLSGGGGGLFSSSTNRVQIDYGLFGPAIDQNGEWYRIFTSGFVHANLLHLAFNMLIIYQVSLMLEPVLGPVRYTLTYISCLIGGSAGALLLDPSALTVGASGVAFGLVGCALAGMWLRKMPVLRSNLGGLLIINLVITFAIPGISIGGHIGGLVAGFLCGLILLKPRRGPAPVWDIVVPFVIGLAGMALSFWAASTSQGLPFR